jgi:hypothetical protein
MGMPPEVRAKISAAMKKAYAEGRHKTRNKKTPSAVEDKGGLIARINAKIVALQEVKQMLERGEL